MEATTKVLFEIIFHLSNHLNTTKVIKMTITMHFFAVSSPDEKGSRGKCWGLQITRPRQFGSKPRWFRPKTSRLVMTAQVGKPSSGRKRTRTCAVEELAR